MLQFFIKCLTCESGFHTVLAKIKSHLWMYLYLLSLLLLLAHTPLCWSLVHSLLLLWKLVIRCRQDGSYKFLRLSVSCRRSPFFVPLGSLPILISPEWGNWGLRWPNGSLLEKAPNSSIGLEWGLLALHWPSYSCLATWNKVSLLPLWWSSLGKYFS